MKKRFHARGRAVTGVHQAVPVDFEAPSTRLLRMPEPADAPPPAVQTPLRDHFVDDAILALRGIVSRTVARGAQEVGEYVLRVFYNDDPGAYASHAPHKPASLTSLLARCDTQDLPISRGFISNAIRTVIVARSLPAGASFGQLPFSHRVELLRLPSPERIEHASHEALAAKSSVRDVRARVATLTGRSRPTKRRAASPVKALRHLSDALSACEELAMDSPGVQDADRAEFQRALLNAADLAVAWQKRLEKRSPELFRRRDTPERSPRPSGRGPQARG